MADPGDSCPREGCPGVLELVLAGDCSCHIAPPCSACTDATLVCSECGREPEEET